MNISNIHSVHFLGIGGIGMSALARWFKHVGICVSGYDKTASALTDALEAEGMQISFEDTLASIPAEVLAQKKKVLIVWTPAIPKDSVQLDFFRSEKYHIRKRAEVLGMITAGLPSIAVAGTHGKTTTSSMVAHLLKSAGRNIAAFLGGLTQNYGSNLILHNEAAGQPTVVVEADEFDRSFLHLHPNIAVVTSVDPDHLDIYGDPQNMIEGFGDFVRLLPKGGRLYIQAKAARILGLGQNEAFEIQQYGIGMSEIHAANIQPGPASFSFDYICKGVTIEGLRLHMPGFHNVENALAAISIALDLGIGAKAVREGLASFNGVKRRFEIWLQDGDRVFIDDYAHHPEEIRAFLSSVKAMYPQKKLTAVFQPHLYTRTRDFAEGFSESLSIADEVVLLEIYPARELPIQGVEASMLLPGITSAKKSLQSKENLINYLDESAPEVLVTIGAGDIDRLVEPIANWMKAYEN